jgi:HSP20 family protein
MSLIRWQPIQELDILRRQMDQLFEGLTEHDFPMLSINGGNKWIPAIEMQETDTEVILKAQIPGVEAKDRQSRFD